MQHATCGWCLAIVKAPDEYNRLIDTIYCSKDCLEKDWLFRQWQSNEWLTHLAEKRRGQSDSKQKD